MDEQTLTRLLEEVRAGTVTLDAALESLRALPFRSLSEATLDTHRALRQGVPEVVFGEGKSIPQLLDIAATLVQAEGRVLCTRLDEAKGVALSKALPAGIWEPVSRTFRVGRVERVPRSGHVVIVTAGTSDEPVAREAAVSAEWLGDEVRRVTDVGVAGLHRLLAKREEIASAAAVIAIAGMEGALASVVAGLVSAPVIAVPTSVGYGANFGGLAALLSMLSSCAPGVGVVNIDNGFGAAVLATKVTRVAR